MALDPDYRVDLSVYNGPLDLLLYLIREREMDIHAIPIAEITEQFLAHLEVIRAVDVDRAGDFLLMAATLMLIKSRMLLPRQEQEGEEEDDLDPRTDLVQQLLEYKRFKDLSRALTVSEEERRRLYEGGGPPVHSEVPDAGKLLEDLGVDDLLLAYERLMRETLADVDHQVYGVQLPLREVAATVLDRLRAAAAPVPFLDFFAERRDRYFIVSVFLSLLEMLRSRRIRIDAGDDALGLRIELVEAAAAPAEASGPPEPVVPPEAGRADSPPPEAGGNRVTSQLAP